MLSSLFVFFQRKLVHAVLALTMAFSSSSMLFLVLNQPFIALLQLLVFVGGLSTYLMISLSNEEKKAKYLRLALFVPLVVVLTVWFYFFAQMAFTAYTFVGGSINNTFAMALENYYPLFFIFAVLLFATALGSVLFIKKLTKLVT